VFGVLSVVLQLLFWLAEDFQGAARRAFPEQNEILTLWISVIGEPIEGNGPHELRPYPGV
jgi:hypothetical protein